MTFYISGYFRAGWNLGERKFLGHLIWRSYGNKRVGVRFENDF
jgi:hypothetical protein